MLDEIQGEEEQQVSEEEEQDGTKFEQECGTPQQAEADLIARVVGNCRRITNIISRSWAWSLWMNPTNSPSPGPR
jgi:hypothetical protein